MNISIPENDKFCVNCEHWIEDYPNCLKCVNGKEGNTKNYFEPEDDYLSEMIGCKACAYYKKDEVPEECLSCSRSYMDNWTKGEVDYD